MPVTAPGDMARQFASLRAGGAIKSDLAQLSASLSTGRIPDITRHLGGDTAQLSGIQHRISQLDGYRQAASETDQMLGTIQQAVARVDDARTKLADQLLVINDTSLSAQVDA